MNDPERLEKLLERQISFVRAADAKLALLMPTLVAMMGIALTMPLIFPVTFLGKALIIALFFVASAIVVVSFLAGLPRTELGASTPIHFSSAAKLSLSEYRNSISSLDADQYIEDLVEQCHINSRIAAARFKAVRWSFFGICVFIPIWLSLIASLSLKP